MIGWRRHLSGDRLRLVQDAKRLEREARREERKALKAERRQRDADLALSEAPNRRQPRERDSGYTGWLHDDISCVACLIEGRPERPGPIEAAHQKLNLADKGWVKISGRRAHDHQQVPLCRWHHQDAPNACDKGQRQFWDRLTIGDLVADLCAELYAAFKGGRSGEEVVQRYARDAVRAFGRCA